MNGTRRSEAGMAILETALVLPLLLFVVFGIVEIGLAFARFQVVLNAAREGARTATLFRANCDPDTVANDSAAAVNAFSSQLRMGALKMDRLVLSPAGATACSADTITVNVRFQHEVPLTSAFGALLGNGGPVSFELVGTSVQPTERRQT